MLILTRKPGESVYIGDKIKVQILETKGNQVRVGIDAPTDLRIYREEIYLQILEENKEAAGAALSAGSAMDQGLEGLSEAWKTRKTGDAALPKGISALGTYTTSSGKDPEVIIKRKRIKTDSND